LEVATAIFGIACQTQLKGHDRYVLRRKTEIHLQSLLQTTQREQRSGHQHKAERDLNDDEYVAEGQATAPPGCGSSSEHHVRI